MLGLGRQKFYEIYPWSIISFKAYQIGVFWVNSQHMPFKDVNVREERSTVALELALSSGNTS